MDYGALFTWCNLRQWSRWLLLRLERFYGPHDDIIFSGKLQSMDVLMGTTSSNHFPIQLAISLGEQDDSPPSFSFNLNVSHFKSLDFRALVYKVWNLSPRPLRDRGWFLWWDATIFWLVNFKRGWDRLMAWRRRRELKDARHQLEEVGAFRRTPS